MLTLDTGAGFRSGYGSLTRKAFMNFADCDKTAQYAEHVRAFVDKQSVWQEWIADGAHEVRRQAIAKHELRRYG